MNFTSLIFDGMASTVEAVTVIFVFFCFLDFVRSMIFSDR